jgi:preprotein translocase subunit SecA
VAQAGERYAVTIATNMAGRGTDIILGGNPIFKVKQKITEVMFEQNVALASSMVSPEVHAFIEKIQRDYQEKNQGEKLEQDIFNLPYSLETAEESLGQLYNYFYQEIYPVWEKENQEVKNSGGLFVLGTERHETRRIDNQLRGRAGRQGDPGYSQFFVCLEDDLIKVFGGDSIKRWIEYLVQDKDMPLESDLLTKSLENAQKKVEMYNYDLRKNVFQYDEILNTQRKQLFSARNQILCEDIYSPLFLRLAETFFDEEIRGLEKKPEKNTFETFYEIEKWFDDYSTYNLAKQTTQKKEKFYEEIWISNDLRYAQANFYQPGFLKNSRSIVILSVIDFYWTEHLERMNYIRETISWRSYGQQNPLVEYNMEAFRSLKLMFQQIRSCMLYYFLSNPVN